MKKVTEFREIPGNFRELYVTEFGRIPPELQPKNRRNSVETPVTAHGALAATAVALLTLLFSNARSANKFRQTVCLKLPIYLIVSKHQLSPFVDI